MGAGRAAAAASASARPPPGRARPQLLCRVGIYVPYLHPLGRCCPPVSLAVAARRPPGVAWRRLEEWERAGVFDRLSLVLLDRLGEAGRIDLGRVSVDSASLRALKAGAHTGANPVDRGKRGSKLHLAGDNGAGVPLVVLLTAANIPDGVLLEALIDDLPAIRMATGRRRRRPGKLHGDKAYDSRGNRRLLRGRGIVARIARRGVESSQRLGRVRWKAERTIGWLFGCRRLRVRYERSDARFYAFVLLACSLLSFHLLQQPPW